MWNEFKKKKNRQWNSRRFSICLWPTGRRRTAHPALSPSPTVCCGPGSSLCPLALQSQNSCRWDRPACSDSATAPMIDKQRQRLTTIQVQPWLMEGRSIKWFKHFIETWLPRHFTLFYGLFSVQLLIFFASLKWREHISYSHLLPVKFRNY